MAYWTNGIRTSPMPIQSLVVQVSITNLGIAVSEMEYRSDDWYFFLTVLDIILFDVIPRSWCFDDVPWLGRNPWKALASPWGVKDTSCGWGVRHWDGNGPG
jgi:hypothetical protein